MTDIVKKKKKIPLIKIKGIGKRGKNPHVNFAPTDTPQKLSMFKEESLTEQPVVVVAKSSKTGRNIKHRFRTPEEAAKHYHKWLTSGRLKNVQLTTEELSYDIIGALSDKANDYSIHNQLIQEVYSRGLNDWTEDKPVTKQQWAFARVNSFLEGGRALELDEDLITEAVYKITARTSNKSLGRLARRKDSIGRQAKAELKRRLDAEAQSVYTNKGAAQRKLQNALVGRTKITPAIATKLIKTLGINPKSAVAKSINAVAKKTEVEKTIKKHVKKHLKSAEHLAQEKAERKAQREAARKAAAEEAERLKNQRLTAKQQRARELEDQRKAEEDKRIADIVAATIARQNAEANAIAIKNRASEELRKKIKPRPQPDTGVVPTQKKGVLSSVLKLLGKKKKARPAVSSSGRPLAPIEIAALKDSE